MPFVPLGLRGPHLDEDREGVKARLRERDAATIASHKSLHHSPSKSGYRFANHPATTGQVYRGETFYSGGNSLWRPPSADPNGPAAQRNQSYAGHGAYMDGSHGIRKAQSTPALSPDASRVMIEACHPLSIERKRWEGLAHKTQSNEMKDMDLLPEKKSPPPPEEKRGPVRSGLVLFPKYSRLNSCHLKMTELQRFQKEQIEGGKRAQAEWEASQASGGASMMSATTSEMDAIDAMGSPNGPGKEMFFKASWGAPALRQPDGTLPKKLWAGSGMAAGRGMKTSNPFRMG